jgi:hypothetical protein
MRSVVRTFFTLQSFWKLFGQMEALQESIQGIVFQSICNRDNEDPVNLSFNTIWIWKLFLKKKNVSSSCRYMYGLNLSDNRAQFCLLKWWPGRPNFKSGGQGDHQRNWGCRPEIFQSNFQYQNWPTEKDIELEDWLNHWKTICFYSFTYLLSTNLFYLGH